MYCFIYCIRLHTFTYVYIRIHTLSFWHNIFTYEYIRIHMHGLAQDSAKCRSCPSLGPTKMIFAACECFKIWPVNSNVALRQLNWQASPKCRYTFFECDDCASPQAKYIRIHTDTYGKIHTNTYEYIRNLYIRYVFSILHTNTYAWHVSITFTTNL